ncbi:MAG: DUF167 domain-containing protein [Nitrospirae bacterium]|nr:DUF167 domain-containing protein [Nitrospirota bacterium]
MAQATVQDSPEGAVLTVHVQPNAARTEYAGAHGDALKFRVAAPPVGGAANETLCSFLADCFGISKSAVVLRSGTGSRHKRVLLKGVSSRQVWEAFKKDSC